VAPGGRLLDCLPVVRSPDAEHPALATDEPGEQEAAEHDIGEPRRGESAGHVTRMNARCDVVVVVVVVYVIGDVIEALVTTCSYLEYMDISSEFGTRTQMIRMLLYELN